MRHRLQAFAVHLGISVLIFGLLSAVVVFVWYPGLFFSTDGGWQGIRIIAAVDLTLGPLLTLIVYRRGKPGLRTDLTLIGTFQALCLAAGTWVVWHERPLALVFVDGRFASLSADSYTDAGVAVPDLEHLPGPYPKWVRVALPDDPDAAQAVRRDGFVKARSLNTYADFYVPFDPGDPAVAGAAFSPERVLARDEDTGALSGWLDEHGGDLTGYRFYPFGSRYSYAFLGISVDGATIDVIDMPGPV